MSEVFLNVMGNGTATTDAVSPMVEGESFTITCTPYDDSELLDIRMFDSNDYPIACQVLEEITMTWREAWGNLYVDIYFTGSETPDDPAFPFVILFKNNEWWRHLK